MRLPKSFTSLLVALAAASWPSSTSIMPPSAALVAKSLSAAFSGAVLVAAVVAVVDVVAEVSDTVVLVVLVAVVSVVVSLFLQPSANTTRNASGKIKLRFVDPYSFSGAVLQCTKSSRNGLYRSRRSAAGESLVVLWIVVELGRDTEDALGRLWPRDNRHLD